MTTSTTISVSSSLGRHFPVRLPDSAFVDGRWLGAEADGAESMLSVHNPATAEVVATVKAATAADVQLALNCAESVRGTWWRRSSWERSAILREVATILRSWSDDAAHVLTSEQGKPLAQASWEVTASADQFDWYADETRRIYGRTVDGQDASCRIVVRQEPVGVVAAFSAWNFPALLSARKIAPALAAGCPVLICPPSEAPLSTMLIAEACRLAGLPAGLLAVLPGDPATISAQLIASPIVRKVSLTGSVPVGRILLRAAAPGVKSAAMELGGHAPVLVFDDADVQAAATACASSKFRNAGQVCAAPSRFFVHEAVAEEFTAAFAAATAQLVVGNGMDPMVDVGPLVNQGRVTAAQELVDDAVDKGATLVLGGRATGPDPAGYYFEPTVLADVTDDMRIMVEEPFVPVAPISTFTDLDDVLARANATDFGLASYVFSRDARTIALASEGLEAGMVGVNTMLLAAAEAPFGGVKMSGFGREGGTEGIVDYLTTKYIRTDVS